MVILNHPRWPDHQGGPFGKTGLDSLTGARASGAVFEFDAIEVVNLSVRERLPEVLLNDWLSLLSRGQRLVALGSSDSHTVLHPVGQGRTYVMADDTDAATLDVDEVCRNLVAGRCSVSLGIFADLRADEHYALGVVRESARSIAAKSDVFTRRDQVEIDPTVAVQIARKNLVPLGRRELLRHGGKCPAADVDRDREAAVFADQLVDPAVSVQIEKANGRCGGQGRRQAYQHSKGQQQRDRSRCVLPHEAA
ncbi:MAG: hypothetical protein ACI9EF_001974 [Pseudohongiellaceae bacterium]